MSAGRLVFPSVAGPSRCIGGIFVIASGSLVGLSSLPMPTLVAQLTSRGSHTPSPMRGYTSAWSDRLHSRAFLANYRWALLPRRQVIFQRGGRTNPLREGAAAGFPALAPALTCCPCQCLMAYPRSTCPPPSFGNAAEVGSCRGTPPPSLRVWIGIAPLGIRAWGSRPQSAPGLFVVPRSWHILRPQHIDLPMLGLYWLICDRCAWLAFGRYNVVVCQAVLQLPCGGVSPRAFGQLRNQDGP